MITLGSEEAEICSYWNREILGRFIFLANYVFVSTQNLLTYRLLYSLLQQSSKHCISSMSSHSNKELRSQLWATESIGLAIYSNTHRKQPNVGLFAAVKEMQEKELNEGKICFGSQNL